MRPLNLRLQGFSCFSDPVEIDFRGMDVFAVTGPTGAGKTTIIDAICYALYGRVPRYEDKMSLISHNRDTMSVQLEFEAGEGTYRVHRGINRTPGTAARPARRTLSPVQLEERRGDDWEPLADRVKSIDDELARIVGLDFKTFTSCVLLPQGRFQEFLTGDKKDRRQVLIDLLGIGIYERIMAIANEQGRRLGDEAAAIGRRLREDYADATPEVLERLRTELHGGQEQLVTARGRRDAFGEAMGFAQTVVEARGRQRDREEQGDKVTAALEETKKLALDGQTRLEALREAVTTASKALEAIHYDAGRHSDLRLALVLTNDLAEARRALGDADRAAQDCSAIDAATAALTVARARHDVTEAAVVAATEARREAERSDVAAHLRQGLRLGDTCPVCGAVVGELPEEAGADLGAVEAKAHEAERLERVTRATLVEAEKALAVEWQRMASRADEGQRLQAVVASREKELHALLPEGLVYKAEAIEVRIEELAAVQAESEALSQRLAGLRQEQEELAPRVAASDQEIARLETQTHQLWIEAAAAIAAAETAKAELVALCQRWGWQEVLSLVEQRQDPRRVLQREHAVAQVEAESLTARVSFLASEVERLDKAIERAAVLGEEMEALKQRGDLHRELGRLLRADAFQGFVIEEAMASLAESASRLLESLYSRFALLATAGEFQVIDHWQADQVRPARTLSGGETFAVSLALALALAERLPELRRAAATTLESLFLDEGFGTLDQETLDTVIGALEGLRSQERLVGIITHVPELARRIECRIEVQTSPSGSGVTVVGA